MNVCREKVAIIGVGNPLLGDDRAGYCFVEALRRCSSKSNVCFYTLETLSPGELWVLEGKEVVVIVDVIEDQSEPGEVKIYEADPTSLSHEELLEVLKNIDPHETDPARLILLAYASGIKTNNIYVIGIRATHYVIGEPVSKPIREKLENLVEYVEAILEKHKIKLAYSRECFSKELDKCTRSIDV